MHLGNVDESPVFQYLPSTLKCQEGKHWLISLHSLILTFIAFLLGNNLVYHFSWKLTTYVALGAPVFMPVGHIWRSLKLVEGDGYDIFLHSIHLMFFVNKI